MKYLKIPQNEKFMLFFELVEEEARKFNAVFFADWVSGWKDKTRAVGNLEAAELRGWLIPLSRQDEFESIWKNSDRYKSNQLAEWDVYFRHVEWHFEVEELIIEFWDHNPTPEQQKRSEEYAKSSPLYLDGPSESVDDFLRKFFGLLPGESFDNLKRKQALPLE